jgi:hypothetical protein
MRYSTDNISTTPGAPSVSPTPRNGPRLLITHPEIIRFNQQFDNRDIVNMFNRSVTDNNIKYLKGSASLARAWKIYLLPGGIYKATNNPKSIKRVTIRPGK